MSANSLTQKQKEVFAKIKENIRKHGTSPTLRELKGVLKLNATSSVQRHVDALKKKGYLDNERYHSRSLKISSYASEKVSIPLVGNVACGRPLLAQANIEAYIPYETSKITGKPDQYFFLRAVGDSMNRAGIDDGDFVLVKSQTIANLGERIVALIEDEATIKKLQKGNGYYILQPESTNSANKPILLFEDFLIQGIVTDVIKNSS